MKRILASVFLSVVLLATYSRANDEEKDGERLKQCGTVLKEILDVPDSVPQGFLDKADCVVVFPSVRKAALGIGASYGRGAMTCRQGENFTGPWGAPTMMALEGASFGFRPQYAGAAPVACPRRHPVDAALPSFIIAR